MRGRAFADVSFGQAAAVLRSAIEPTVRLAATLAAKRFDINRHRSTTTEHGPRSQAQIDASRHAEGTYGSAVGFV